LAGTSGSEPLHERGVALAPPWSTLGASESGSEGASDSYYGPRSERASWVLLCGAVDFLNESGDLGSRRKTGPLDSVARQPESGGNWPSSGHLGRAAGTKWRIRIHGQVAGPPRAPRRRGAPWERLRAAERGRPTPTMGAAAFAPLRRSCEAHHISSMILAIWLKRLEIMRLTRATTTGNWPSYVKITRIGASEAQIPPPRGGHTG